MMNLPLQFLQAARDFPGGGAAVERADLETTFAVTVSLFKMFHLDSKLETSVSRPAGVYSIAHRRRLWRQRRFPTQKKST
jgi:hypothetical protein